MRYTHTTATLETSEAMAIVLPACARDDSLLEPVQPVLAALKQILMEQQKSVDEEFQVACLQDQSSTNLCCLSLWHVLVREDV